MDILESAEYKGKKVKLNKPFRVSDGKSKFAVYVKNAKGNVIMVRFGDPNMEIKRDDPERRKSFRARHKCDTASDKTSARYWSCKMWQGGKSVGQMTEDEILEEHEVFVEDQDIEEELSRVERIKRGRTMKRKSKIIARKRERALKRAPTSDAVNRRARKRALKAMKDKLARGRELSPAQKSRIEKKVKQRSSMVDRLAKKFKPQVRKDARERMKTKREMQESLELKMALHLQEQMASYVNESVEDKIKALYKKLVAAEKAGKDTEKLEAQIDALADKAGMSTKQLASLVESVNEDDAFLQAADAARDAGKSHFMFNGKKFPVTLKKDIPESLEEAELMEGNYDTYTAAIDAALSDARKKGYDVSDDEAFNKIGAGPGRPKSGKTTRHSIELTKGGKPSKKQLHIQVYNRETDKKTYELNHYIN